MSTNTGDKKEKYNVFGTNQIEGYEFYKSLVKLRSMILGAYPKSPKRIRSMLGTQLIREISEVIKKLLVLDTLDMFKCDEASKRIEIHKEIYANYKLIFQDMTDAKGTSLFSESEWETQFNLFCNGLTLYEGVLKRDNDKFDELYPHG